MVFTSTAVPSLRLHVQDLPEAIDILTPGGVYALVVDTPPSRFPLLAACIGGALGQGLLTSLLLATPPQPWLERLAQLGLPSPDEAVQTGRLQVFSQQTDFTKKLFRHGTPAFVQELEYFGLPRDSLLVVDQADDLLSLHDMGLASGQAEVLSHWARAQGITLLLVFNRVAAVAGAAACLNGLMDSLRGIARLGGHGDGLNLRFDYWQSPGGTVAAKDFALSIQDNGWYKVRALVPQAGTGLVRADAEHPEDAESHNFYYLDDPLDTLSQMVPGQWRKVDSVMSILREAVGTSTPSVLLCFKAGQSLRGLAESVHALRLALGRRARIVVVERDMSLRYANEVLLLRLGANLIMHRDMSEARMVLMLESLQGQTFSRDLAIDFEQALLNVTTPARIGYAHPGSFCSEVQQVVERLNQLNIPSTLVMAPVQPGLQPLPLLQTVTFHRQGDLFTTDGTLCYFFFCGCPPAHLAQVWAKVLPPQTREQLASPQVLTNNASILQQVKQLAQWVQGYHFPDDLPEHLGPAPSDALSQSVAPAASVPLNAIVEQVMPTVNTPEPAPAAMPVTDQPTPSYTALLSSPLGSPLTYNSAQATVPAPTATPGPYVWSDAPPAPHEPNTAALLQKMLQALPTNQSPH